MTRRRSRAEIIRDRKFPAPPPTPKGHVYAKKTYGLQLVPADKLSKACKQTMDAFDNLSPEIRAKIANGTHDVGYEEMATEAKRHEANKGLVAFGFAIAR
jgi:hypothetical protein